MMRVHPVWIAAALGTVTATAGLAAPKPPVVCPPPPARIFISPMGEPFRSPSGAADPVAAWFAAADADRDGRLTVAEMAADADRFFTTLDLNGNGEIAPVEIADYENRIAPEIRLYQLRGWPGSGPYGDGRRNPREPRARKNPEGGDNYGGELGAGRLSWLNIPEPVASADLDLNRGISRPEFRSAAIARFALLDKAGAKALTLATLPPLPLQAPPCPPVDARRSAR
jgi:hypothetical protein